MNIAVYRCEENSSCTNYQSAICLHCTRRLCLTHITEHNQIILNTIKNLSNEIEDVLQQINDESDRNKNIYDNILTSLDQWRTEQIEKIEPIYENQLNLIEIQQKSITDAHHKLCEQLDHNARQPLEQMQKQQNTNILIFDHIKQTIRKVQEDNVCISWNLSILSLPTNIEYSSFNILSRQLSNINNNTSLTKKKTLSKSSLNNIIQSEGFGPLKQLSQMFSIISSIEKTKNDIDIYIKNLGDQFLLSTLVCSYLTAWHRKSNIDEKVFLLTEHILTIKKYLKYSKNDFDVLLGIQKFIFNERTHEDKSEMMAFLLQFFLNHQCIYRNQILNWYKNKSLFSYKGFQYAKKLATPFIQSICNNNNV